MEVPVSNVGGTQVGRLVYQVMGSNGPIHNPAGIRYLPPDHPAAATAAASVPTAGLDALAAAGLYAQLGLQAVDLYVSVATLKKVREIEKAVAQVSQSTRRVETTLEEVVQRTRRIDAGVAAQNLRSSLQFLLKSSLTYDHVFDLVKLSEVSNDVDEFSTTIGLHGLGSAPGLRLPADLRTMIEVTTRLFRAARTATWAEWNRAVEGDPDLVLTDTTLLSSLTRSFTEARLTVAARRMTNEVLAGLSEGLANSFLSQKPSQFVEHQLQADEGELWGFVSTVLQENAPEGAVILEVLGDECERLLGDPRLENEATALFLEYLEVWHDSSDAGIVYQLGTELTYHQDPSAWPSAQAHEGLGTQSSAPTTYCAELSKIEGHPRLLAALAAAG